MLRSSMALFVLREGYRVTTTEKGGCVVHIRTGDTLELSALELHVLARSTAGGIDANDARLKGAIKKLTGLGLLVKLPPPAKPPGTVPTFDELSLDVDASVVEAKTTSPSPPPSGPLPRFRGDLKVVRRGETNLYDVTDAATRQTLAVYDYEISLARMLDGKRTYDDVFQAAKRLGIPINADSLMQFIKQLSSCGFIAAPGAVEPDPGSTFPSRKKWDPSVRVNFQTGLRLGREGRYPEAIAAFELVLTQDPDNPEAKEALAVVRRNQAQADAAAAAASTGPMASSTSVFELDVSSFSEPKPAAAAPTPDEKPAPVAVSAQEEWSSLTMEAGVAPRRSVSLPIYLVSVAAAIALGWLGGAQLGAGAHSSEMIATASSAQQAPVAIRDEPDAAAPSVAAVAPIQPPVDAPIDAGSEVTEILDSGQLDAPEAASVDAGEIIAVEVSPAVEVQPSTGWANARIVKRGRVTMGTIEASNEGRVTWSATTHAEVKRGSTVGFLNTASGRLELTAPKAGLFAPSVSEGEHVKGGDVLASIVYTEGFIQATVDLPKAPASWACEVSDKATGQKAPCKVIRVTPRAKGFSVTATTDPLWFDSCAKPVLRLGDAG